MVTILIAGHNKSLGYVVRQELQDAGHSADIVRDGVEAVLRVIDGHYQVVLLDMLMPRLDGLNALRIIRKISPETQAIIFSENAGSEERDAFLRAGAALCLSKPCEMAVLKRSIRELTESRDLHKTGAAGKNHISS